MIITPANKKKKKNEEIAPTKIITKETKEAAVQALDNLTNQSISKVKSVKNAVWGDGYQIGDITKTLLAGREVAKDLNPVKQIVDKTIDFGKTMVKDIKEGRATDYIKSGKPGQEIAKTWDNGYQFGDVTKTLLNADKLVVETGADVLANLAKGELQTAEGLVDTGRYLISDIASVLGAKKYSENVRQRAIQNTTGAIFGENDAYNNPTDKGWLKRLDEYSVLGNRLDSVVQSVGQQAFRVGLQEGIGSAAGKLGATASQAAKAEKIFNNVEIFAGAYGSAKSEALANGADYGTASLRGVISGTAEYISEHLDEGMFVKTGSVVGGVKSGIASGVEKAFNSKLMGKIALGTISGIGEGLEERLSNTLETIGTDVVNLVNSDYTYGMQEGQGLDKHATGWENVRKLWDDARASYSSEESKESAEAAFWSTIITFGFAEANTNINKNQAIKAVAQENHISEVAAAKIYDAVVEARTADLTTKDTRYDELYNIRNQVSNELSQGVKEGNLNLVELNEGYIAKNKLIEVAGKKNANGQYVVSTQGLNLVDSYKAYNGNDAKINEIANVQKYMEGRNIDSRFDATMFKNSNENSLWTTKDGRTEVIFNPNASQDQIIESLATHEMTHDIMSQKTETGKSLFKDVLDYAKQDENYKQMRAELEDLYAQHYDKNAKNFKSKIDEEIVANYLGENLGTQEYINRLVGEKPNMARRIYDWVTDKIDNIGQTEEYKQEKKYWKDIADKFEKAYNEQKQSLNKNETAYSFMSEKGLNNAIKADLENKNLKYRLEDAKNMVGNYTNEEIRQKTRWFQDENGKWLFEISDKDANFDNYAAIEKNHKYKLKDIFNHSALFEAYPQLENKNIIFKNIKNNKNGDRIGGYYNTLTKTIVLNNFLLEPKYSKYAKNIILHELQHSIQQYEGLELGDKGKNLTRYYSNLGEIQSSEVESRSNYDYNEILENPPKSSQKNPIHDYIEWLHKNPNSETTKEALKNKQIANLYNEIYNNGNEGEYNRAKINKFGDVNNKTQKGILYNNEGKQNKIITEKELKNSSFSLTTNKDSQGRTLSKGQQEYFKNSKARNDNGELLELYHGTAAGEFTVFDKSKGNVEGDFGLGFYFTNDENDVANNYEDGGADFDNKVSRLAERIQQDQDIDYEQAEELARKQLYVGANRFTSYLNLTNPAIVGETRLFDYENYMDDIEADLQSEAESYQEEINEYAQEYDLTPQEARDEYFRDNGIYDEIVAKYLEDDIESAVDIVNNELEIYNPEELRQLLWENVYDGGIEIQELKNKINERLEISDSEGNLANNEAVRLILETLGYDGIIDNTVSSKFSNMGLSSDTTHYIVFNPNQIKNIDNLNPTTNEDIRYATQTENEIAPVTKGTRTTFGELFPETVAPIREDISKISKQVENLSKQIETLQNEAKNTARNENKGYVETYKEQRYENQDYAPLNQADAELYQNALMSDEGYINSLEAEANNINDTLINTITNNVQNQLGLSKNQKTTLENIVRESIENDYSTDEISQRLEQEFKNQEYKLTNEEAKSVKKLIKLNPIKVSDGIKKDIADYNDFQRRNLNKITFSRNGVPVDVAYRVLNEQAPGYFPSDIINPTDQLLKISDVANMANETIEKVEISSDVFDNMADYITNSILEERYNNQVDSQASLSKDIQFNMTDDILPTTIRSQEAIDEYIDERDIAPVREETPFARKQTETKQKLNNMRKNAQEMFINRNYIIDKTAQATGNNEIKFAGDNLNSVSGEAQFNINNNQTDMNGNWIGKSVHEIFQPARDAGLYAAFNDYLIQKSNIERHNVGKGSQVPLAVSQQLVARYELENPQFKTWAKDVYKYFDNVLQEQLDSGLITKEQYDNFRGEHGIYRSYVPFYEADMESNRYFDNEGNLKAVSTLKRAKGNATDVNQMLSVEDSMARQTYAYKRAIRQNELYKQIVSSSERFNEMMDQDVRTNPTNLDDSLYITNEGDKVLTAYINGEKVSAIISDELFNELSGENEARIKQIEEDFSLITNPLQKVSNVRRNLLTSWNPTFLARNAIKDIQDAVINSKHTADMLANYFGTKSGQKSAIMELREAKTQEAQQFLALYGADNLYGNYENVGKSNNLVNKFARINELIELAPRYAEFKASLQNGDSINEAIYNAREVTTNFGRGGYITKALNRNGFTFLNANVQGLNKLVRNLSGENGVKGVTSVIAKGAAFAVLPSILNHLMYGSGDDKDEEYEALPDYIKDNYYLVKLTNGNFLRIPKGRINSVFGSLARRTIEAIEGEENAYEGYGKNAWSQIGIGDLGENNIFAPIIQAKNNKAWYGGDIVPTRLQNLPAGEQSDEKTDALSKFVGETLNISPKKINYVLDQYSGGLGDVLLPMMTPATTSGADNPIEYLTAPIKDSFVVNSIDDNKYAGDFYDTKEKLQVKSNSQYATDEDKLRYKYMSNISSRMSELYAERREVQADTKLSKSEKYAKVQAIQNEINNLAKEALSNYNDFSKTDSYVEIGDVEYYKDTKGEWTKVNDSDAEFTAGMTDTEKTSYYNVKNKISTINSEYNNSVNETTDDATKKKYQSKKKEDITQAIINSGLDNYTKAMIYSKHYSNANTMNNVVNSGYDVDTYITALYDIEEIRNKYSQANGYTTEQRKQKTIAYINSLNMNIPQKAMLIRNYYSSFRTYNKDIVNYVNNLDITREEKVSILQDTGMTVNGNNVSWK